MYEQTYRLAILPFFEEELRESVDYIQHELRNPQAADKLIDSVFAAIDERLKAPLAFEPHPSQVDREQPYYKIPVGNFFVLYVVIGDVMEVRRFIYQRRNWRYWSL